MKKILLAVAALAVSGVSFAFCPDNVDKIYGRLQAHDVKAVNLSYSADKADWQSQITKGLEAKGIKVNVTKVDGTGVCMLKKGD